MIRTNIVLDEELINSALAVTRIKTRKALIDYALRELLRHEKQKEFLKLRGKIHWEGNLALSRKRKRRVILVDTTIWIDFFSNRNTKQVSQLIQFIEKKDDLCVCGVILTEILQGIKNSREYQQVEKLMSILLFLEMRKETFILAADIYRSLRSRGITVRKTLDCMIAAVAIENKVLLLHHDRDFDPMEKYCGLQVSK